MNIQGGLFDGTDDDRTANPAADVESDTGDEPVGQDAATRLNPPFRITFHHTRKRLADVDGLSGKAAIDGLVKAGILPDDSAQQITAVHHRQSKGTQEKTIIEIEEIETDEY